VESGTEVYQRFGEILFQSSDSKGKLSKQVVSKVILPLARLDYSSTLRMEAVPSFETPMNLY
jgi:hypothetical protein